MRGWRVQDKQNKERHGKIPIIWQWQRVYLTITTTSNSRKSKSCPPNLEHSIIETQFYPSSMNREDGLISHGNMSEVYEASQRWSFPELLLHVPPPPSAHFIMPIHPNNLLFFTFSTPL
jgi:hypothetical protein